MIIGEEQPIEVDGVDIEVWMTVVVHEEITGVVGFSAKEMIPSPVENRTEDMEEKITTGTEGLLMNRLMTTICDQCLTRDTKNRVTMKKSLMDEGHTKKIVLQNDE